MGPGGQDLGPLPWTGMVASNTGGLEAAAVRNYLSKPWSVRLTAATSGQSVRVALDVGRLRATVAVLREFARACWPWPRPSSAGPRSAEPRGRVHPRCEPDNLP
jgi:hypothetical protein